MPLSAMGVDRDAVVRTELLASRAARGLTGLFWWGFVLGSGSVDVGPLGVRRDAALMPFWRSFVLGSALVEPVFGRPRPSGGVLYCKARLLGLRARCFASEAEISKGYRHFASVITLAKCCIAARVWYRCENGLCRVGIAVKTGLSCAAPGLGRSWARWFRRASNGIPVRTESVAPPQPAPVSSDRTGSGIGVLPSAGVCLGEGEAVAGQGNGHWSVAVGQGNGNWGREPGIGAGKLPAPIRRSLPQCEPAPCADGYGMHRGAGPATGGYTARPLCGSGVVDGLGIG